MDDCSPTFFVSMRRQLLAIPPDDLVRVDLFRMREFALEALKICEAQSEQLFGGSPEEFTVFTATLQKRLEQFSGPTA